MQLVVVLALIATISIAEAAPQEPVSHGGIRLLLALMAMAIAPLFAVATSSMIASSLRYESGRRPQLLRLLSRLRGMHVGLWLLLGVVVLYQIGWVQLVRFNWRLDGMFLIDDLVVLFPVIMPLLLSWAAFYDADRALQWDRSGDSSFFESRAKYLSLHARHYLGLVLAPALLVLATHDLVRLVGPSLPGESEALLLLLPVAGLALFFPMVIRIVWRTEPLAEGSLRTRLLHVCHAANFRPGELLVWETGRGMVNAAVAGLVRPWRYVFFTDALLERFDDAEVEVVLSHEIGHVRQHHLAKRLMMILSPVLVWFAIDGLFPQLLPNISTWLTAAGISESVQQSIAAPLLLAIYAISVFAWHSHRLEHEADLFAARAVGDARRIALLLDKLAVVGGIGHRTRSWLHPTISRRIDFLLKVAEQPSVGNQFERRLRWIHAIAAITAAASIGLLIAVTA